MKSIAIIPIIGLACIVATGEPIKPQIKLPLNPVSRLAGRFQIVKFSNNLSGRAETGVLRLDRVTGATWVFEDADVNGAYVAVWVRVNEALETTADMATNTQPALDTSKAASNYASH